MKSFRSVLVAVGLLISVATTSIPAAATSFTSVDQTASQCLKYSGHAYEVCTAYIFNSSIGALQPYYKYSRGGNVTVAQLVTDHLAKRYSGSALTTITARVAKFPAGNYTVEGPRITVISASSNLTTNSAVLQTRETWTVRAANGAVVYAESNRAHTVHMARVPSYVLHKWVVTSF